MFNASSRSESGLSLNDVLCVGPTVQPDSFDILLRYREKEFVLSADVTKMYRQVWVHPSQWKYLKVLWRPSPNDPLKHYELRTVTFGTASAPFLATRAVNQLASEYSESFPETANIIRSSFFVDDAMFGVDSIVEGIARRDELREIFGSAGMELRKWSGNNPELLKGIAKEDTEVATPGDDKVRKKLGLVYDDITDMFSYDLKPMSEGKLTKAKVLSEIASMYDLMGWLGPINVKAKLIMKKLWLVDIGWKDEIPSEIEKEWNLLRQQFPLLNEVHIKRHCVRTEFSLIELHGFCDASIEAYAAAVYLRTGEATGDIQVSLLCGKSRVAPKSQKSLARLELCSAVLLVKLVARVLRVMTLKFEVVNLWSDSTIVLSWIKLAPSRLSVYVGNRVAKIQELAQGLTWHHIRTDENPADVIFRGLMPQDILLCELWWNGPSFFKKNRAEWPAPILSVNESDPEMLAEIKKKVTFTSSKNEMSLFAKIELATSRFNRLIVIFAYVHRFADNCKKLAVERKKGPLEISERETAELSIFRVVQQELFPAEYVTLLKRRDLDEQHASIDEMPTINRSSKLLPLSPFMDKNGLIRVGGRISACRDLSFRQKHPIILPSCRLTMLLLRHLHEKHLHPTALTLQSIVRDRFWILRLGSLVRKIIHECLTCFRVKPIAGTQIMADLPAARVNQCSPFASTAVDYAGYFWYKSGMTRRAPITKCYVAVFKCMVTGAIHLEVVTDLSTNAFLAALDRFVSRRGLCHEMFSDNGKNFEGANNELMKVVHSQSLEVAQWCCAKNIKWRFTAPMAPHAGGIYESAVKSMKHHLNRLLVARYTLEQMSTLLCKIEAVLNSRPLTALSSDPNDLEALTPGHFLIGRALVGRPTQLLLDVPSNRLQYWSGLQQVHQEFWKSWYSDYLKTLQTRPCKFRNLVSYKVDDLVLLMENNVPPMKWLLGRISGILRSKGDIPRVVTVRTKSGLKQRQVQYLCPLPSFDESFPPGDCVAEQRA